MIHVKPLAGMSVLILEDSYYIADEAQRTLELAGARVLGPCRDMDEMLNALQRHHLDCALVDINPGEGPTFEPARILVSAGVTVILMTGYDTAIIPAELKHLRCLQKPVEGPRLVMAVASTRAAA